MRIACYAVIGLPLLACSPTPEDTVRELGKAISAGNRLRVEELVDIPQTSQALMAQLAAYPELEIPAADVPTASRNLGNQFLQLVETGDVNRLRLDSVGSLVSTTSDSGRPVVSGILKATSSSRLTLVTLLVLDSQTVDLKLAKEASGWRVVGVEHLDNVLAKPLAAARHRQRIATLRADLRDYVTYQEAFFTRRNRYASSVNELMAEGLSISSSVTVLRASSAGHLAEAVKDSARCIIYVGATSFRPLASMQEAAPACP